MRASVRSDAGAPSVGSSWMNSVKACMSAAGISCVIVPEFSPCRTDDNPHCCAPAFHEVHGLAPGSERCPFLNTGPTWLRKPPQKGVESTQRKIVLAAHRHSGSPSGS